MPKREPNFHGLLIVDKPGRTDKGLACLHKCNEPASIPSPLPQNKSSNLPTSHDIVQMARRWCQQRRIGHTGTLDPMASGVLVLCLGVTTRLVEYYQNHPKQYYAEICLGYATDTYDAVGQISAEAAIPSLNQADIEAVLADFQGEIMQKPPLYSAIKKGGESLHRKARRGEHVVIEPRKVTFHQVELIGFTPPERIHLRIVCSAGTYIRSLAYDLGKALQTHGYLDVLRREASGSFTLNQAYTPDEISLAADEGRLSDLILPSGFGLSMPTVRLSPEEIRQFGFGQTVLVNSQVGIHDQKDDLVAATDAQDKFVGIIRRLAPEVPEQLRTPPDLTYRPSQSGIQDRPNAASNTGQDKSSKAVLYKAEKWFINS